MGKLIKFLFLLALLAGLAGGGSYAAAYFGQGEIAGVDDAIAGRTVHLAWQGDTTLPGRPRVWVFEYDRTKVPGLHAATIWVDLKGNVVATRPRDLADRVERWRASTRDAD